MTMTNIRSRYAFTTMPPNKEATILCGKQNMKLSEKKWHLAIRAPRDVVDHTIEDASVCDATTRVAAAMVSELRVYAAANVVERACNLAARTIKTTWLTCLSSRLLVIGDVDLQHGVPYPIDSVFCKQALDREEQYRDTINRNPGTRQFNLFLRQKRAVRNFCFLHKASQQPFTRQQRSNAIRVYEKSAEQFPQLNTF
ncbi:hypothetical protein TNCV_4368611 [Trichonephila clavipes]|nr:hypothetical protein TNCV_4368611 [Trichonephila clavipes]